MPRVIDSEGNVVAEYGYTEAEKEAAAEQARDIGGTVEETEPDREAMAESVVDAIPAEETIEEPVEEPVGETIEEPVGDLVDVGPEGVAPEGPEGAAPTEGDQDFVMDIFKAVFSPEFDPNDSQHKLWLGMIEETLGANPEMAEGLKSGDVPMTEFAMLLYRGLPPTGAPPELPPSDAPAVGATGPYFA